MDLAPAVNEHHRVRRQQRERNVVRMVVKVAAKPVGDAAAGAGRRGRRIDQHGMPNQ
jgi:hypothetical protein